MAYMRKSSVVDAQIIHMLMSGKPYKRQLIAERLEISTRTVTRGIERLRFVFVIHFGNDGVWLDECHLYYGLKRTG